jgi:hypothetical protein
MPSGSAMSGANSMIDPTTGKPFNSNPMTNLGMQNNQSTLGGIANSGTPTPSLTTGSGNTQPGMPGSTPPSGMNPVQPLFDINQFLKPTGPKFDMPNAMDYQTGGESLGSGIFNPGGTINQQRLDQTKQNLQNMGYGMNPGFNPLQGPQPIMNPGQIPSDVTMGYGMPPPDGMQNRLAFQQPPSGMAPMPIARPAPMPIAQPQPQPPVRAPAPTLVRKLAPVMGKGPGSRAPTLMPARPVSGMNPVGSANYLVNQTPNFAGGYVPPDAPKPTSPPPTNNPLTGPYVWTQNTGGGGVQRYNPNAPWHWVSQNNMQLL